MTARADYLNFLERLMGMSDETWKRHASPWSVYTRMATTPFIVAAIWLHTTIGYWSITLLTLLVFWIWINPRLFPAPKSTDNWGSKATFGERVYLNRKKVPIPKQHRFFPHLLGAISGVGFFVMLWGAWKNFFWPTATGFSLMYLGKLWFLDRMVWLYEDMKDATPEYRSWLYGEKSS